MYEPSGDSNPAADPALPPAMTVQSADIKGHGVFSNRRLVQGDIAIIGRPVAFSSQRTWKTLQMGASTHALMDAPFEYVNHSCDPNCGIKPNRFNGYSLVAMRPIEIGEEITFDYCMTEWICVGFSDCRCNSDRCRKVIRGAKFLSLGELDKYGEFVAPYYEDVFFGHADLKAEGLSS